MFIDFFSLFCLAYRCDYRHCVKMDKIKVVGPHDVSRPQCAINGASFISSFFFRQMSCITLNQTGFLYISNPHWFHCFLIVLSLPLLFVSFFFCFFLSLLLGCCNFCWLHAFSTAIKSDFVYVFYSITHSQHSIKIHLQYVVNLEVYFRHTNTQKPKYTLKIWTKSSMRIVSSLQKKREEEIDSKLILAMRHCKLL